MKNIVIGALTVVVLSSLAVIKSNMTPTVHFVIPQDFRGLFVIYEDKEKGQNMLEENGEFKLFVSSNGETYVTNAEVFGSFHREKASFKGGPEIPIYDENPSASVALWGMGTISGGGMYYFVGSRAEYQEIRREFDITKLPLGDQTQSN